MKILTQNYNDVNVLYSHKEKRNKKSSCNPSFNGTIIPEANKAIMTVFREHYGSIGDRIDAKLYKLKEQENSSILKKSSRFDVKNGTLVITEKKIARSIVENIFFPFVNLPLYASSAILKQAQKIPFLENGAKKLYKHPIFRIPRKLNEMDSKTDILQGMLEKTDQTVEKFAKSKGMKKEELLKKLIDVKYKNDPLVQEANKYIKENLYKVSNKFFDKHTGNFNTAHERPLNRWASGVIPVFLLGNDRYNLKIKCGDTKEEAEKEAKEREKQEIIRLITTSYIQLITFGAFTKEINTLPWFAPAASAATVLFSEILSRKKIDKPVFFLSKESAMEYNEKQAKKKGTTKSVEETKKVAKIQYSNIQSENNIFKGFSTENSKTSFSSAPKQEKKQPKKALMNFDTFKKAVAVLTGTFFGLSFLRNSSLTKNTFIVKGMKDFGDYLKKKVYNPLAYKDFEISKEKFDEIMNSLDDANAKKIADGHRFISENSKYAEIENGVIKLYKSVLNSDGLKKSTQTVIENAKELNSNLNEQEVQNIENALKTAIKLNGADISKNNFANISIKGCDIEEGNFENIAKKTIEIIQKKKVNLDSDQIKNLENSILEVLKENSEKKAIQVATKMKPFVDIVAEPFRFIYSAARLPFKLVTSGINMLVKPIEKKAAKALLGEAEMNGFEKAIHRAVTEIYGENQGKTDKISQEVFANAMEQLEKKTKPFRDAQKALDEANLSGANAQTIKRLEDKLIKEQKELEIYVNTAVEKSFNGVTQSSNKNTDLALMSKIASSAVTTAFLVADDYNVVMLKSNGDDKEDAKEKANERIIQRLSGLFYQALFINWFNATFRSTYNSSLMGMCAVTIPNTLTTEVLTRKSIGMPVGRMTLDEINEMDRINENRTGLSGKYFEFMRLLTGKKPLKDRVLKEKQKQNSNDNIIEKRVQTQTIKRNEKTTNILEMLSKK